MFGLSLPLTAIAILSVLAAGLGALWWFDTGRIAAERDLAVVNEQVAIDAAHSAETAMHAIQDAAAADNAVLLTRAQVAEARAAALSKSRKDVVDVGTKDAVGLGVAAAVHSLRGPAPARDEVLHGGDQAPAGPAPVQ